MYCPCMSGHVEPVELRDGGYVNVNGVLFAESSAALLKQDKNDLDNFYSSNDSEPDNTEHTSEQVQEIFENSPLQRDVRGRSCHKDAA